MSKTLFTRKSTFFTIALGLTALGTTMMPAAAGPFSQLVHASPITPNAFPHPAIPVASNVIGSIHQKPVPEMPGAVGQKPDGTTQKPPVPGVSAGPVAGPTINNQPLKVPVGEICAQHPTECAPHYPQPWPPKKGDDDGDPKKGPIAVQLPPVVIGGPSVIARPVYVEPPQVATSTQPAVARAPVANTATPVAQEPCNCLTKQYLDDGSVLFRDLCTREAAMATPAELKAQAQAQAQGQTAAR